MATYLVTGSSSGIGAAITQHLRERGHQVVTVDLRDADYCVDLSEPESRASLVKALCADLDALDGVIPCAGVASHFPDLGKILSINYFGTVELLEGVRPLVQQGARIIVLSSNAGPMSQNPELVQTLLAHDEAKALKIAADSHGQECYASSKKAVALWMRRQAPALAQAGININAIAPGYIETPMTASVAKDATYGDAIRAFVDSIPVGRPGQTADIVALANFLLSPQASFIAGSLIFIDGAHDALFRPDGGV